MDAVHRRYIKTETLISMVLNAIVGALFVWIMFRGLDRIGLWGSTGLALDLVPTVFMITLMTTIALTLITRARVRKGAVPRLAGAGRTLPRMVGLRAIVLALVATLAIVPVSVALLWLVWIAPWSYWAVLVFKTVYSAALGLIVTPLILKAALRDGGRAAG